MIGASSIVKSAPRLGCLLRQTRNFNDFATALSAPPRVTLSTAEKMAHALVISVGILGVPAWVLCHLEEYKGEN
uniref:Putative cytochrome oxidase c subunit viii n=1 Tax=Xenopsylla cheopis TaxID=163159 RepID=A0A6M2DJ40_XENCH